MTHYCLIYSTCQFKSEEKKKIDTFDEPGIMGCMNNELSIPRPKFQFKLICVSKCKKAALEIAKSNPAPIRAKMFSRVSEDFLIACEANLRAFIETRIKTHPSKGKTLT